MCAAKEIRESRRENNILKEAMDGDKIVNLLSYKNSKADGDKDNEEKREKPLKRTRNFLERKLHRKKGKYSVAAYNNNVVSTSTTTLPHGRRRGRDVVVNATRNQQQQQQQQENVDPKSKTSERNSHLKREQTAQVEVENVHPVENVVCSQDDGGRRRQQSGSRIIDPSHSSNTFTTLQLKPQTTTTTTTTTNIRGGGEGGGCENQSCNPGGSRNTFVGGSSSSRGGGEPYSIRRVHHHGRITCRLCKHPDVTTIAEETIGHDHEDGLLTKL